MKKILLLGLFALMLGLNACQCANPPPVGPVEGEDASVR